MAEPDTTIPAEGEPLGKPSPGNSRDFVPGDAAPGPGADVSRDPDVLGGGGEATKANS